MDEKSVIQWSTLMRFANNDKDTAEQMLQLFVDSLPDVIKELEQKKYDQEGMLETVHKLHGACAYCGVEQLEAITDRVEKNLHSTQTQDELDTQRAEITRAIRKIQQVYEEKSYQ